MWVERISLRMAIGRSGSTIGARGGGGVGTSRESTNERWDV